MCTAATGVCVTCMRHFPEAQSTFNIWNIACTDLLVKRLKTTRVCGTDWQQKRNFFGLPVEKFHQPLALWHPTGHYIIAAAAHGFVYVFHVGSGKVSTHLPGSSLTMMGHSLSIPSSSTQFICGCKGNCRIHQVDCIA